MVSFISEGYFYIVDLSQDNIEKGLKVKINIRLPDQAVKKFDVDYNMTTVLLASSNGNVFLYDLPKALENERILAKKKLEMGVEDELVYTYLEPVTEDMALESNHGVSFIAGASVITHH